MFTFKKNEVTGLLETNFSGTLKSIPSSWRTNTNGKEYGTCGIEYINSQGNKVNHPANVWRSNFNHGMKVGDQYLCTARVAENGNVYLSVSHLQGSGELPSASDFGFPANVVQQAVAESLASTRIS